MAERQEIAGIKTRAHGALYGGQKLWASSPNGSVVDWGSARNVGHPHPKLFPSDSFLWRESEVQMSQGWQAMLLARKATRLKRGRVSGGQEDFTTKHSIRAREIGQR